MSTLQTTHAGALRRWGATAVTLAGALIAVAVAVLLIAFGGGSPQHVATPRHGPSVLAPGLRHEEAADKASAAATSTGKCTYVRAEHRCVTGQ
jgi:hypothetical protein